MMSDIIVHYMYDAVTVKKNVKKKPLTNWWALTPQRNISGKRQCRPSLLKLHQLTQNASKSVSWYSRPSQPQ